jgi:hypothetical protein
MCREEEVDDEVDAERADKCREIRECPAHSASITASSAA